MNLSNRFNIILTGLLAGLFLMSSCTVQRDKYEVASPNEKIKLKISLKQGKPQYTIHYHGKEIISPSELGINLDKGINQNSQFKITNVQMEEINETWQPLWGIKKDYQNHYNEMKMTLETSDDSNYEMQLIFRAYDEGMAFRYHIPEQPELSAFRIKSETTGFNFPANHECFAHPRRGFEGNYENTFDPITLSDITPESLYGIPLLVKSKECWVALMEADLTNYSGMSLTGKSQTPNGLISKLAPYRAKPVPPNNRPVPTDDQKDLTVVGSTPLSSPWRVFMIAEKAGAFIESPLIYNLNDPNKLEDISWIKPGKVTWPWWNGRIAEGKAFSGEPGTVLMKHYTDFAARNDIPYLLVDAGWYSMEGDAWDQPEKEDILTMEETRADFYNIHEVIDYANEKKVDVMLWLHVGSIINQDQVDKVLAAAAEWGAKGIKIDYYGGEYQELVNHIHYILEIAAKHQLLVDYHGAYKPTGIHRTYPHFMTSEGILGLEWSKGNKIPKPAHNVTIPYTRMLCGPMDYTPGAFDLDGTEESPKYVQTTRAHQMAMYVVYFSPLQMLVDYPAAYEGAPEQFEFLKEVPVTWDDTKFIKGEPGQFIAVARKNGHDWYIGIMNNHRAGRDVSIHYDFLEEGKNYKAHIYKDAEDADQKPEHVSVEEDMVKASDNQSFKLASGGGTAIWLEAQ